MTAPRQKLVVLGASGTIGQNTLDVVARHPQRFEVLALSAWNRIDRLAEQCRQFQPLFAVVGSEAAASGLRARLAPSGTTTTVLAGEAALETLASLPEADTVMLAIVGAAGLRPALAAARSGKKILLANKESLVMAGPLFMQEIRRSGSILIPIDSEHNAIFQSLPDDYSSDLEKSGVRRLLLTASGGPFLKLSRGDLDAVTPAQACAHPNWVMGPKISVDSATMMNKGLEVIEAHWLFDAAPECIEVVIHPQSIIHSLVEYIDGSVIAQLGHPDMRTPIAFGLAYPERIAAGVSPFDLCRIGALSFSAPDPARFPCLGLAYQALRQGGSAPAILNAANEVAVASFLEGTLRFTRIAQIIEKTLNDLPATPVDCLETLLEADTRARQLAREFISRTPHG